MATEQNTTGEALNKAVDGITAGCEVTWKLRQGVTRWYLRHESSGYYPVHEWWVDDDSALYHTVNSPSPPADMVAKLIAKANGLHVDELKHERDDLHGEVQQAWREIGVRLTGQSLADAINGLQQEVATLCAKQAKSCVLPSIWPAGWAVGVDVQGDVAVWHTPTLYQAYHSTYLTPFGDWCNAGTEGIPESIVTAACTLHRSLGRPYPWDDKPPLTLDQAAKAAGCTGEGVSVELDKSPTLDPRVKGEDLGKTEQQDTPIRVHNKDGTWRDTTWRTEYGTDPPDFPRGPLLIYSLPEPEPDYIMLQRDEWTDVCKRLAINERRLRDVTQALGSTWSWPGIWINLSKMVQKWDAEDGQQQDHQTETQTQATQTPPQHNSGSGFEARPYTSTDARCRAEAQARTGAAG